MNQALDYYKILEVRYGADKADITSSYKRLCKLYHPDINRDPKAEDLMKLINTAYHTLTDDIRRTAYNNEFFSSRAQRPVVPRRTHPKHEDDVLSLDVINKYFQALLVSDFETAYELLSEYDRQYVTLQSFTKWRSSVSRLFSMREFYTRIGENISKITLEDGRDVPSKKHYIGITEKNLQTGAVERYHIAKFTIVEHGVWRVFLGYRDLNEIAKMFEKLSLENDRDEMERLWQNYCAETCRELDMPSIEGLIKRSARELYRHERYGQAVTLACFSIARGRKNTEILPDILECASKAIMDSLRETDIPAYAGDGVFAVLFVELKKKNAELIISRLAEAIKSGMHEKTGNGEVDFAFAAYNGGGLPEYIDALRRELERA